MLLLPGSTSENRHFQRFSLPLKRTSIGRLEPTHQRDFEPHFSPKVEAVLRATLAGPAGAILEAALGRKAELCELTAITANPGATKQGLHADACWTETAPRLITIFLALHDILDETLGPTRFCPETHVPRCFPGETWHPPPDRYSRTDPRSAEKLAQTPPIWFPLHAGDAVAMDSTTWHQGSANTSSDSQRTLLCISFVESQSGESADAGASTKTLLSEFVGAGKGDVVGKVLDRSLGNDDDIERRKEK
eukprot:g3723.t1